MSALRSFPLSVAAAVGPHWDGQPAADLFAPCGTPVLAVEDGYADAYSVPLGGNAVSFTFADGSGAAYYAHLGGPGGAGWFGVGSVIGYVGDTGNAAGRGCHLHFAVATSAAVFEARNGAGDLDPAAYLAGVGAAPADGGGGGDQGGVSLGLLLLIGAGLVVLLWPRD